MFKVYLIVLILQLGLFFQGCAPLQYLDGSSKENIKKFKITKAEIWNEMEKIKIENVNLQGQINILRKENQSIRDQNERLNEQMENLEKEKQRIRDEDQVLATKLTKLQLKYKILSSKSYGLEKDIRKLKIKVLSGDGNFDSAKEMAKRLRNMGYKIKLIDYAPHSHFLQNIVYSTPKFQNDAKHLVLSLGGNTIFKPLTWPSIFDLIVLTGKHP